MDRCTVDHADGNNNVHLLVPHDAFDVGGVTPADHPEVVQQLEEPGVLRVRVGAAGSRYLADIAGLPPKPRDWPHQIEGIAAAVVSAIPFAADRISQERANGQHRTPAIYSGDIARGLQQDPRGISRRFGGSSAPSTADRDRTPISRRATRRPQHPTGGASEMLPAPRPEEVSGRLPASRRQVGDTIAGRFEVRALLGSGGFSNVYKVRDAVEEQDRALKLFESAAGYDAVRWEINALRRVDHPNVVKVIWADRTDTGEWYLIMEYVDGEPLEAYANGTKRLCDGEAVDVALDVLDALVAIHPDRERLDELDAKKREGEITSEEFDELMAMGDKALVHRDIKPQNVILTRSGAKVLDFNIASRVGDPVRTVSGTPPYQPPDADLTSWDVSTDLFAVGVTLYQLICDGHHPYPQRRPLLDLEPTDPHNHRTDIDQNLAAFLVKACAPEREARFQTAAKMKGALEAVRDELKTQTTP